LALEVEGVHTYYGESHVLQGISLQVEPGEVLAILGRNGMGKTTLIRTIVGFTPPREGRVRYKDTEISRLPSAPRLNVGHHAEPDAGPAQAVQMTLQSQWLKVVRQVMSSTEDVGDRFAEEARRIHYGEVEERGIRGRASSEDAQALREEGIAVVALPLPDALKGPIQ